MPFELDFFESDWVVLTNRGFASRFFRSNLPTLFISLTEGLRQKKDLTFFFSYVLFSMHIFKSKKNLGKEGVE